jgi:hypothetical protein
LPITSALRRRPLLKVADDVVVGDDDARAVDHEAGTGRLRAALLRSLALALLALAGLSLLALTAPVEEFLEQVAERRVGPQLRQLRQGAAARVAGRDGGDVDHGRHDALGQIGQRHLALQHWRGGGLGRRQQRRHHQRCCGDAGRQHHPDRPGSGFG